MAAASKPRLSLVERQQMLLEERGFSRPQPAKQPPAPAAKAAASSSAASASGASGRRASDGAASETSTSASSSGRLSLPRGFMDRQEALLARTGRGNATPASRKSVALEDEEGLDDGGASVPGSVASRAPSMHPSVGQVSLGCSESTLGAGDDTKYWDYQHRKVGIKDLGHKCHECKLPLRTLGEPLTERRGARISMRYHGECFSGFADPRSQSRSSNHEGVLAGTQMEAAPGAATVKMRTSCHFEGGRAPGAVGRAAAASGGGGVGGKFGAQMSMGHGGFGSRSSKGKTPGRAPGGFTESQLAAHERRMDVIAEAPEG